MKLVREKLLIKLYILLIIFSLVPINTNADAGLDKPHYPATVVDILVRGSEFHGKQIIVPGYLGYAGGADLPALYFVSEHVIGGDSRLGVFLDDTEQHLMFKGNICEHLGAFVQVIGRYDSVSNTIKVEKFDLIAESDERINVRFCFDAKG